jgi:ribonuclease-3
VARRPPLSRLQERIGYRFRNDLLLHEALTHASAANGRVGVPNYERLEFLGDRVLGLAVAEHLFTTLPMAPEGQLALRFNRLVKKATCAEVAREIDLGVYLKLGESESHAGGRSKDTILADSCEALLGAIYLDGGWTPVKAVVETFWAKRASEITVARVDAKTALQEWVQGQGQTRLPKYVKIEASGPAHEPLFTYEVRLEGYDPARGTGPSRRSAEQIAAAAVLIREGVWPAPAVDCEDQLEHHDD